MHSQYKTFWVTLLFQLRLTKGNFQGRLFDFVCGFGKKIDLSICLVVKEENVLYCTSIMCVYQSENCSGKHLLTVQYLDTLWTEAQGILDHYQENSMKYSIAL